MFVNTLDPVIFSLGPVAVRWYGLVYVLGFLAFYWALRRVAGLSERRADSLVFWLIVGLFLGARSFFFVFYRPDLFSIGEFFAVWRGGMSFHGALVGLAFALFFWAQRHDEDAWRLADLGAVLAGFFLFLGRIANFVNSEIVGPVSDAAWCVQFPRAPSPFDEGCRHPVQLYSAFANLVIGGVMLAVYRSREYAAGFVFWVFVTLYGASRFTLQFWRLEPAVILGLQTGHLLSLLMVVAGTGVLVYRYRPDLKKLFKPLSAE